MLSIYFLDLSQIPHAPQRLCIIYPKNVLDVQTNLNLLSGHPCLLCFIIVGGGGEWGVVVGGVAWEGQLSPFHKYFTKIKPP